MAVAALMSDQHSDDLMLASSAQPLSQEPAMPLPSSQSRCSPTPSSPPPAPLALAAPRRSAQHHPVDQLLELPALERLCERQRAQRSTTQHNAARHNAAQQRSGLQPTGQWDPALTAGVRGGATLNCRGYPQSRRTPARRKGGCHTWRRTLARASLLHYKLQVC